jgi:hypothetical protein
MKVSKVGQIRLSNASIYRERSSTIFSSIGRGSPAGEPNSSASAVVNLLIYLRRLVSVRTTDAKHHVSQSRPLAAYSKVKFRQGTCVAVMLDKDGKPGKGFLQPILEPYVVPARQVRRVGKNSLLNP